MPASNGTDTAAAVLTDDADVEAWWADGADVTGRLIAAVAVACAAAPEVNARFDSASGQVEMLSSVDIGIAIGTERRLLIPVLCDIGHLSVSEIRRRLNELRKVAGDGPCQPSITLANFGYIGGRYAALPIVPPQVAIIGVGHVSLQAAGRAGCIVHHHMLPLSLNFDPRACGLVDAVRFLVAMKGDLVQPELPLMRGWHSPENPSHSG
jgi:2-oxoisovalerate dehydrogenase E2 component (dihydrolipoyl transacylase)